MGLEHASKPRGRAGMPQTLGERGEMARDRLAPLFENAGDNPSSALLYRAMNELHALYPELSQAELEALFSAVSRHLPRLDGRH